MSAMPCSLKNEHAEVKFDFKEKNTDNWLNLFIYLLTVKTVKKCLKQASGIWGLWAYLLIGFSFRAFSNINEQSKSRLYLPFS